VPREKIDETLIRLRAEFQAGRLGQALKATGKQAAIISGRGMILVYMTDLQFDVMRVRE
jgi:hypothetical protein